MPLQAVRERTKASYHTAFVAQTPEELLTRLIASVAADQTSHALPQRRSPERADEVLFEAEIDGAHYYVVRNRPLPSSASVSLSPRELAIAQLIAKGLPNKSISDLLEISPYTVATHLRRIFVKLGVSSRAAMVARLLQDDALTG